MPQKEMNLLTPETQVGSNAKPHKTLSLSQTLQRLKTEHGKINPITRTKSDSDAQHRSRSKSSCGYRQSLTATKRLSRVNLVIPFKSRSSSWDAATGSSIDVGFFALLARERAATAHKPPLERICLHCQYTVEMRHCRFKLEVGKALKSMVSDMEDTTKLPGEKRRTSLHPSVRMDAPPSRPNIVVSAVSSDSEAEESEAELSAVMENFDEQCRKECSDTVTSSTSSGQSSPSASDAGPLGWDSGDESLTPLLQPSISPSLFETKPDIPTDKDRDQWSSSITTYASKTETTTLDSDGDSSVFTASSTKLSAPDISPPDTPLPTSCSPLDNTPPTSPCGIPFDEITNSEFSTRPPLESFSSGKTSCSCIIPSCIFTLRKLRQKSNFQLMEDGSNSESTSSGLVIPQMDHLDVPSSEDFRSSSIDLATFHSDVERLSSKGSDHDPALKRNGNTRQIRSHSVDYSPEVFRRPSRLQRLTLLFRKALVKSPILRHSGFLENGDQMAGGKHRTVKYWMETTTPTEHIWLPTSSSGGTATSGVECYVGERDCRKDGDKRRCAACHVVAHSGCLHLVTKMNLNCKPTYRDTVTRNLREERVAPVRHHWVHRWRQEGRCGRCGKSFQQKLFNRDKEVLAIVCSWCKTAYHNRQGCFLMGDLESECSIGSFCDILVPPTWIIKLPVNKATAFRRRFSQCGHVKRRSKKTPNRLFVVRPPDPIGPTPATPLLVFVNPKSGGNKGSRLMNAFCWLLNPRQVFDIMAMKGPKYGLEMYRRLLPRLRILVCGGDGTVGWVLSTLDSLRWPTYPPIGILPLGTGNDLARTLGWGGTFADEPMGELLAAVAEGCIISHLDRWKLEVEPNMDAEWEETVSESAEEVVRQLPLTVMNNYFSIGADAHVALQFHQSRSAKPDILNSRFKNRLFYGGIGTVDLFKRSWKDLADFIKIECDGVDLTPRIQELKLHCILFLNIPRYAGGTLPWGSAGAKDPPSPSQAAPLLTPLPSVSSPGVFQYPSIQDGKIEILGFTTASLAAIQVGAHGERLAQCSKVTIETRKPIPAQVDGEPCRLAPSKIKITFHSKVPMLQRITRPPSRTTSVASNQKVSTTSEPIVDEGGAVRPAVQQKNSFTTFLLKIPLVVVSCRDYDSYKSDVELLKQKAFEVGMIGLNAEEALSVARPFVDQVLLSGKKPSQPYAPSQSWHFLDYISSPGEVFRVMRGQEKLQSVLDVCSAEDCVMVMDETFPSSCDGLQDELAALPDKQTFDKRGKRNSRKKKKKKRFSDSLRLILSSETEETAV